MPRGENTSKAKFLLLSQIETLPGGRQIDEAVVDALADSIGRIQQRHPIVVFRKPGMKPRYVMTAGAHRRAACEKLGHLKILAIVLPKKEAILYRTSENLHRAELRVLDKLQAIHRYDLDRETVPLQSNAQPHDKGISNTARDLNVDRKLVREARLAAEIRPEAKAALIAAGFDDNRVAIAAVADEKTKAGQLKAIEKLKKKKPEGASISRQPTKMGKFIKKSGPPQAIPKSAQHLKRLWDSSAFKTQYEAAPDMAREEFVRLVFSEILLLPDNC